MFQKYKTSDGVVMKRAEKDSGQRLRARKFGGLREGGGGVT